jgi:hypothetical protein
MLKSVVLSSFFLVLSLIGPAAQAQDWCGPQTKENTASSPTPGHWYRLTGADMAAAKKASLKTLERVFGNQAENVLRASRRNVESIKTGEFLCVPVVFPGEIWTPMPKFYEPAKTEAQYTLVDIEQQFLGAYEHGQLVFSYPISSGKRGKDSPLGLHRTMQKKWYTESSSYKTAEGRPCPMPHAVKYYKTKRKGGGDMWTHQGTLPGHRASHGCIRSDDPNSQRYFRWVQLDTPFEIVPNLK